MRRQLLITIGCLLCTAAPLDRAEAQGKRPFCSLSIGELRELVLKDGAYGIVFPLQMVARHDTILVFGTSGVTDATGKPLHGAGGDSATVGFLLTNGRRTTAAIPAPPGLPTARYFRVRASDRGWEAVFFVPDRDTIPGTRFYDDGTFWYGRLRAGRWNDVERIGRVQATVAVLPNSSGLTQSGPLSFAVFFGEPASSGGVIIWQRAAERKWRADTVQMRFAPLTVTATSNAARPRDTRFFPVATIWGRESTYVGSLLSVKAVEPTLASVVRLSSTESMNQPVEYALNGRLHMSWWEFDQRNPPNLWYQALDPERENVADARRRVARGINDFTFLAVPEGAQTRLVWAYRPPDTIDSAEVAVVANGEPMVVGRVAFPFGFMTAGVASGDRSFTLATTPRPAPDGEPSASRTLEVRVNCRRGT